MSRLRARAGRAQANYPRNTGGAPAFTYVTLANKNQVRATEERCVGCIVHSCVLCVCVRMCGVCARARDA